MTDNDSQLIGSKIPCCLFLALFYCCHGWANTDLTSNRPQVKLLDAADEVLSEPLPLLDKDISFDIFTASFFKGQESILTLGDSYSSFKKLDFASTRVTSSDSSIILHYRGISLDFEKKNEQKVLDPGYNEPEASDTLRGITINSDYPQRVILVLPITGALLDFHIAGGNPQNVNTEQINSQLTKTKTLFDKEFYESNTQVLTSRVYESEPGYLSYELIFQQEKFTRRLILSIEQNTGRIKITSTQLNSTEIDFLFYHERTDDKATPRGFGPFSVDDQITLQKIANYPTSKAILEQASGKKFLVDINWSQDFNIWNANHEKKMNPLKLGTVEIKIHNLTLFAREMPCKGTYTGPCLAIIAISAHSFHNFFIPKSVINEHGLLMPCGSIVSLNDSRSNLEKLDNPNVNCRIIHDVTTKDLYYFPNEKIFCKMQNDRVQELGVYSNSY